MPHGGRRPGEACMTSARTPQDRATGDGADPKRPPWRVEGMDQDSSGRGSWLRGRSFWWWFAVALLIIWIRGSIFMGPPERTDVSYTFFTQQLDAGNVETVTTTADTIEGEFKNAADYPPASEDAAPVDLFTTQRPSFAADDLLSTLESQDVTVNATDPDAAPPLWQQVLVGFGPTLLLLGLLLWFL